MADELWWHTVETKLGHGEGIFARDFGEEQAS